MSKELIGIFGGTFDPIHAGHIAMAESAAKAIQLDRVLMLPTGCPPHKTGVTPAEDRWKMLCAACANKTMLEPSRIELDRQGTIYTVDTLTMLHELHPKAELYYIIGADTLFELKTWRNYEQVLKLCTFLVCPRPWDVTKDDIKEEKKRLKALGGRFIMVDTDPVSVSSTEIRHQLAKGSRLPTLPVEVFEYARLCGLYGMPAAIQQAPAWMPALFEALTRKRFSHTLAVAYTAKELAAMHGVDPLKAETAALLHDCGKCLPTDEMTDICIKNRLTDDRSILERGELMHSLVGAFLAQTKYGVNDPEILDAIAHHTTGSPGMSKLDMVVYLADKIEPTRKPYPSLETVRKLAEASLEQAMICSMEGTGAYVQKNGKSVHPSTLQTLHWLHESVGNH